VAADTPYTAPRRRPWRGSDGPGAGPTALARVRRPWRGPTTLARSDDPGAVRRPWRGPTTLAQSDDPGAVRRPWRGPTALARVRRPWRGPTALARVRRLARRDVRREKSRAVIHRASDPLARRWPNQRDPTGRSGLEWDHAGRNHTKGLQSVDGQRVGEPRPSARSRVGGSARSAPSWTSSRGSRSWRSGRRRQRRARRIRAMRSRWRRHRAGAARP
jgi:hypothetical protein